MNEYDLVILGAGPGGYSTALRGVKAGLKTALIEKGKLGGACLNLGCVPAKTWISSAETVDHAKQMAGLAKTPFEYSLDFTKVAEKQKSVVAQFGKSLGALLERSGVTIVNGAGRFEAPDRIEVKSGESAESFVFKNAVIATGSRPVKLFDLEDEFILDSSSVFDVTQLPSSIIIVGAGAIGCEFACVFARMGVNVTIVEMEKRILPMEDHEISAVLARELKKTKVKILTGVMTDSMEIVGGQIKANLSDGTTVQADKALVSIGRKYETGSLGLNLAGVDLGAKGEVLTDDFMRSTNRNVFAVGDVAGKHLLAYTASKEGEFAVDTILGKITEHLKMIVPSTIFTIPEIGSVGLTQDSAPESARKGAFMFRALARAHACGEISGFVKIIADSDSDRILGAHIIGPRATDLVHTAVVAMSTQMTARKFADVVFGHPTFAEAMMEAARDIHGESNHK